MSLSEFAEALAAAQAQLVLVTVRGSEILHNKYNVGTFIVKNPELEQLLKSVKKAAIVSRKIVALMTHHLSQSFQSNCTHI